MSRRGGEGRSGGTEWFGVEVRHLAALAAVAREGSFGGAARRLGYTQSAISGQIATLERIVGARVLLRLRGGRQIELTPEGRVLLRHAETIESQLAAARHDLGAFSRGDREQLRVGTFETVGPTFLADVLRSCGGDEHRSEIVLERAPDGASLLRMLEAGALDLALAALPLGRAALCSKPVLRDTFVLVVRRDDPIAAIPYAEVGLLPRLRLVCGDLVPSQRTFEASLAAADVILDVVGRHELGAPLQELVRADAGIGLVPALSVVPGDGLATIPLEPSAPARIVAIAWRGGHGLSDAAERFVSKAVEVGSTVEPSGGHRDRSRASGR